MVNKLAKLLVLVAVIQLVPALAQDGPKQFDSVDQRAGDCHMSATLKLHPDGHASFDATTWTDKSNSGDIWHATLHVYNSQNQELFGFGVWDSPRMWPGNQYNWRKEGGFPSGLYDQIDHANFEGSC